MADDPLVQHIQTIRGREFGIEDQDVLSLEREFHDNRANRIARRELSDSFGSDVVSAFEATTDFMGRAGRDIGQFFRTGEWQTAPAEGVVKATENIIDALGVRQEFIEFNNMLVETAISLGADPRTASDVFMGRRVVEPPQTVTGGMVSEATEIGTIAAPAAAPLMGLGAPMLLSYMAGGVVAGAADNPRDPNLHNVLLEALGEGEADTLGEKFLEAMATAEDDPEWLNRLRNALTEGALVGLGETAIEGFARGVKGSWRLMNDEAALSGLEEIGAAADRLDDRIASGEVPATEENLEAVDAGRRARKMAKDARTVRGKVERKKKGAGKGGQVISPAVEPFGETFYSAAEFAIRNAKQGKGPGSQWMGILEKSPGITKDELAWLDPASLLDPKRSYTREEVADIIAANRLEVTITPPRRPSIIEEETTRRVPVGHGGDRPWTPFDDDDLSDASSLTEIDVEDVRDRDPDFFNEEVEQLFEEAQDNDAGIVVSGEDQLLFDEMVEAEHGRQLTAHQQMELGTAEGTIQGEPGGPFPRDPTLIRENMFTEAREWLQPHLEAWRDDIGINIESFGEWYRRQARNAGRDDWRMASINEELPDHLDWFDADGFADDFSDDLMRRVEVFVEDHARSVYRAGNAETGDYYVEGNDTVGYTVIGRDGEFEADDVPDLAAAENIIADDIRENWEGPHPDDLDDLDDEAFQEIVETRQIAVPPGDPREFTGAPMAPEWGEYTMPGGFDYDIRLFIAPPGLEFGHLDSYRHLPGAQEHFTGAAGGRRQIGHARFKRRYTSQGEDALSIEELQSDIHQALGDYVRAGQKAQRELKRLTKQLDAHGIRPIDDGRLRRRAMQGRRSLDVARGVAPYEIRTPGTNEWKIVVSPGGRRHSPDERSVAALEGRPIAGNVPVLMPGGRTVTPEQWEAVKAHQQETFNVRGYDASIERQRMQTPLANNWWKMFSRYALHRAVSEGRDGLVLTTGEQQLKVYSSRSTPVGAVRVRHLPDDPDKVEIRFEGEPIRAPDDVVEEAGQPVTEFVAGRALLQLDEARATARADLRGLDTLVGKENAQAIRATVDQQRIDYMQEPGRIEGELGFVTVEGFKPTRVGSRGMRRFYDGEVTPYLTEYVKKQWGVDIEERTFFVPETIRVNASRLGTGSPFLDRLREVGTPQAMAIRKALSGGAVSPTRNAIEIFGWSDELEAAMPGVITGDRFTLPYIPINDAMRESILRQGQPLFGVGGIVGGGGAAAALAAADEKEIQLAEVANENEGKIVTAGRSSKIIKELLERAAEPGTQDAIANAARMQAASDELLRKHYGIDPAIELKAEGLDFNMSRVDAPEDVKLAIDEISSQFAPQIKAYTETPKTHAQTVYEARLMDISPEQVLEMRALDSAAFLRARYALAASASHLTKLAKKIDSPQASDDDFLAFQQHIKGHAILQMHVKGMQTEIARALSAMRVMSSAREQGNIDRVGQIIADMGGRGDLRRMARVLANEPDPQVRASTMTGMSRVRGWQMFMEVYYGALLSNIQTHAVNFTTSYGSTMWTVPEVVAAGLFGSAIRAVRGKEAGGVYVSDVMRFASGWTGGHAVGLNNAYRAFLRGTPSDLTTKIEGSPGIEPAITQRNLAQLPSVQAINEFTPDMLREPAFWLGKSIEWLGTATYRMPTRVMMTADEMNKGIAYSAMLQVRAAEQVRRELASGAITPADVDQRMAQIISDPEKYAPNVHLRSGHFAQEMTFQQPLGPDARAVQRALRRVPLMQLVVPFFKTPTNLLKHVVARSPAAPLSRQFWRDVRSGDPVTRDMALGRMATGSAIAYGVFELAMAGHITGGGPTDPRLRRDLEATGWQPYSFVIPKGSQLGQMLGLEQDAMYSYKRFDPFSQFLGIAADAVSIWGYATEDERNVIASTVTTAVYRNIISRTWMTGLSELGKAVEGMSTGRVGSVERYLTRLGAGIAVPAGVRWIGTTLDEGTLRDTDPARFDDTGAQSEVAPIYQWLEQYVNEIKRRVPGYNQDLPAELNFWGEEVRYPPGLAANTFPMYRKDYQIDNERLANAGIPVEPWRWARMRHPFDMTDRQHREFVLAAGPSGEAVRLGSPFAMHSDKIEGVPMNPDERHDFIKAVNSVQGERAFLVIDWPNRRPERAVDYEGLTMREALDELLISDGYREASDDEDAIVSKVGLIKRVVNYYRRLVKDDESDFMLSHPKLYRRLVRKRLEREPTLEVVQ